MTRDRRHKGSISVYLSLTTERMFKAIQKEKSQNRAHARSSPVRSEVFQSAIESLFRETFPEYAEMKQRAIQAVMTNYAQQVQAGENPDIEAATMQALEVSRAVTDQFLDHLETGAELPAELYGPIMSDDTGES